MNTNTTDFAVLVSEFLTDFLPLQRNYSKNTILSYRDALKLLVVFITETKGIRLADFTMKRFDRQLIVEFLEWLRNRGVSVSTANQRLAAIKAFAEYAGCQYIEYLAPLQMVQKIKAKKAASREIVYLSVEQMTKLINRPDINTFTGLRHRTVMTLLYDSGCRVQEIGGLQWGDIDFVSKFICVKRTLSYDYANGKKTMKMTSPKTENSVRKIPFFGETSSILERQMEKIKSRREELGERWRQPEEFGDLVFLTSMGSPIGRYNVESDMRYITGQINDMYRTEALYGAAVQKTFEPIHPHALRHTFATRCFEKGMTPRTVQEIMGHANYNTTVSYTHVLDDIKAKEALRVGDFLQNYNKEEIEYENLIGIM